VVLAGGFDQFLESISMWSCFNRNPVGSYRSPLCDQVSGDFFNKEYMIPNVIPVPALFVPEMLSTCGLVITI